MSKKATEFQRKAMSWMYRSPSQQGIHALPHVLHLIALGERSALAVEAQGRVRDVPVN